MMGDILIKNGHMIDPANGVDEPMDLLAEKGVIIKIGKKISAQPKKVIDASGMWVVPGLVDMHVHLREPGYEYKESIKSGGDAAAAGGFTSVACMANTNPVNDCASVTEFILEKARKESPVNVFPVGAVTVGLKGEALANIAEMKDAGIVAVSDDGKCVMSAAMLRDAMTYAAMFGLTVLEHAEDHNLTRDTHINEGVASSDMGLNGAPAAAEDAMVARDIALAEYTGGAIHFCHVSTAGAVELIRAAKKRGVKVTAEAAPHHFTLTETACAGYNTNAKMAPPLRTDRDVAAVRKGLADGTLDAIATDHAPHATVEKDVEFEKAPFGIIGLETALPLSLELARKGIVTPVRLVELMSLNPARILRLDRGTLGVGAVADVTVIDPGAEWTVDAAAGRSRSRNTPFHGWAMTGRAAYTIVKGKVVYKNVEYQE